MDGDGFHLHWEEEKMHTSEVVAEEVIYDTQSTSYADIKHEVIAHSHDHEIAAENLMYLSQDVVSFTDTAELVDDAGVECVTEEVITDDWVVTDGQDRVEVSLDHLSHPDIEAKIENDIDVPLPTDQDQYTAMRPWPCDFCSRRFRKKAALMNHMVAHQNDRPHTCNLCGVGYVRKCDLLNHLKVHAFVPDDMDQEEIDYEDSLDNNIVVKPKKKRGRRKKKSESAENQSWENMTSARTQQWRGRVRPKSTPPPVSPPSTMTASPPPASPSPTPLSPRPVSPPTPPPSDPARPFVCKHCGIGFAREKALQSHSRVHGGDSPLECSACGELCWSREALSSHMRRRHPNLPTLHAKEKRNAHVLDPVDDEDDDDDGDDMDYQMSPEQSSIDRPMFDKMMPPELTCPHCGVAFQRADLLRRHVSAAHSHKRLDSGSSTTWTEHVCSVCGETCPDALTLLAHAELHTENRSTPGSERTKRNKGRGNSSNSRQFPCKECGKVFGSRSSQQIHVRIHTGERPYACRFCWKAFADGGTLRKHERIHTGEKPYACAVCPRAFNQRVVLREHVRSHHSAPDRRSSGGPSYACVVCGSVMVNSTELVQHLIQHCDANTALKRRPQSGPRKYKRRRKVKSETLSPAASPARAWSPVRSPPGAGVAASTTRGRSKRRKPEPAPRPRMIHTSPEPRPRTKQVRNRRPPRHPADDLRAIQTNLPPNSPEYILPKSELEQEEEDEDVSADGPYRCEMCDLRFSRREALLLHVPIHI